MLDQIDVRFGIDLGERKAAILLGLHHRGLHFVEARLVEDIADLERARSEYLLGDQRRQVGDSGYFDAAHRHRTPGATRISSFTCLPSSSSTRAALTLAS